jgi:hypothetical protein
VRSGTSHISDDKCDEINLLMIDYQRGDHYLDVAMLTVKLLGIYNIDNKAFRVEHVKQYILMHRCLILIVTYCILFLRRFYYTSYDCVRVKVWEYNLRSSHR